MTTLTNETPCDWTVSGMDCGSCATKIKDAVARLPGVSGVEVGILYERLRLTLDEAQTGREKVKKTVRALGHGIAPRAAYVKEEFVLPAADVVTKNESEHEDDDHEGHDHGPPDAKNRDESGHGSAGHMHDDPTVRCKCW